MKLSYIFIIILLVLSSCKKEEIPTVKHIELLPFTDISIESAFDIELVEDSVFKLIITSSNNEIADKISYEIDNNKLYLKDNRKFKFLKPGKIASIEIHAPEFFMLELYGGVNLTTKGYLTSNNLGVVFKKHGNYCDFKLNNDMFYFWNDNLSGGDIKLRGTCQVAKFWFSDLVSLNTSDLNAESVIISSNTNNDSEIRVTNKLEYEILGEGDVIVYGNPAIIEQIPNSAKGKGELILK